MEAGSRASRHFQRDEAHELEIKRILAQPIQHWDAMRMTDPATDELFKKKARIRVALEGLTFHDAVDVLLRAQHVIDQAGDSASDESDTLFLDAIDAASEGLSSQLRARLLRCVTVLTDSDVDISFVPPRGRTR